MKLVQLQLPVHTEKEKNIEQLEQKLEKIKPLRPDMVMLGEMFTCPYSTSVFEKYAEEEGGNIWKRCSILAKRYHIYLVAGSVPEIEENGKIYNTSYVFDRDGKQIAKHRKVHLFDIDIEGGQKFRESDILSAGNRYTVFDTEFGKMGVCICFDFRFPELARKMVLAGAKMILVPAAFNMTTGPMHWELMFRSRAVDNQCFTVGTSEARDLNAEYVSWGHSILVSPWGKVIDEMEEKEGYMVNEIELMEVDKVRQELPLLSAMREDVYS